MLGVIFLKLGISILKSMTVSVTVKVPVSVGTATAVGASTGIVSVLTLQMVLKEAQKDSSVRCEKREVDYRVSIVVGGKIVRDWIAREVDEALRQLTNQDLNPLIH